MLRQRFGRSIITGLVAVAAAYATSPIGFAQIQPAGIEVDASGVLRTKTFHDPTGRLTRQRLAAARASLDPVLARPSKLRKVCLNRLEVEIAKRMERSEGPSDDMLHLAGLTSVRQIFCYPETGDVVIAGPAEGYLHDVAGRAVGMETGNSVLLLEDLITVLRAFPPAGDTSGVISVSIDPTREGLTRMQQFLARLAGRITPRDDRRIAAGLRENLGLQTVSIKGISPRTHFAQVLVEADYRMKLIGIGLERPPVKISSYVQRANPRDVAQNALQRWYFTPNYECVRVSEDGLAMELVGQGVRLISENELVRADGSRASSGHTNLASKAFVTQFTKMYPALADKSPVYAQLRDLIDLTIAAAFLQEQDYYGQADWEMNILLDETSLPVERYTAPRHVETAVNVVWKGNTLITPVGGGVHIQPRLALASDRLMRDERGELSSARERMELDTLDANQWWWD